MMTSKDGEWMVFNEHHHPLTITFLQSAEHIELANFWNPSWLYQGKLEQLKHSSKDYFRKRFP
jgi:hypothetical protein